VEVLAPGWLRADIAQEMRQAVDLYAPKRVVENDRKPTRI
jgi:hypothetical protein